MADLKRNLWTSGLSKTKHADAWAGCAMVKTNYTKLNNVQYLVAIMEKNGHRVNHIYI